MNNDTLAHIYLLHELFKRGRRLTIDDMARRLECSRRTVIRVKKHMADRLEAPIVYRGDDRTFSYDDRGERYELPGIWLTAEELAALATVTHLAQTLDPGLLRSTLATARDRIVRTLREEGIHGEAMIDRIRVLTIADRTVKTKLFAPIVEALVGRRRLRIRYEGPAVTVREISPQHLVRYRDNWYLDAYCHVRDDLRTFALSRIIEALPMQQRSRRIGRRTLREHFAHGYGLFAGPATDRAVLRFCGPGADYVSRERWHPEQKGRWLEEEVYELTVPFAELRELGGEILRWGPHVEVVAPPRLRTYVADALREAAQQYLSDKTLR